jgi:deazaflavin-dependent oxidoreductase (nitroreductase family)
VAGNDPYDRRVISEFRARGGTAGGGLSDLSMLLLHHTGARTGIEHVAPLAYWRLTDTAVAVLASNGGAPRHPAWYHNLVANPVTTAEIGAETWTVRAHVADADERTRIIRRLVAQSRLVRAAVSRTSREIPVVILELLARVGERELSADSKEMSAAGG